MNIAQWRELEKEMVTPCSWCGELRQLVSSVRNKLDRARHEDQYLALILEGQVIAGGNQSRYIEVACGHCNNAGCVLTSAGRDFLAWIKEYGKEALPNFFKVHQLQQQQERSEQS